MTAKLKTSCVMNIDSYVQMGQMYELKRQSFLDTRLILEHRFHKDGSIWLGSG